VTNGDSLKILQVSSAKEIGGGETHLITLINGLIKNNHQISVAVRPKSPLPQRLPGVLRNRIHEVGLRNSLDIFSARQLARTIKAENIDILHCHYARDYLIGAIAVTMAGRSKLVLTRHVPFPMKSNVGYRNAMRAVSKMICVSESVRHLMIQNRLLDAKKLVTIYNGIEIDRYRSKKPTNTEDMSALRKRLGLPDQAGLFLAGVVGQLAAHKAQDDFVKAASIIHDRIPSAHFVVSGKDHSRDSEYKKLLERLVSDAGLEDRVTFIEHIDDLPSALAAFDVLVMPSITEAFGLVLVEAMATGTNVVATNIEGPSEIVQDQFSGLSVPPKSPDQIASAVIRLWDDAALREKLAANAEEVVTEKFSAERMVAETEAVYRDALNSD
jgi:glycosyltransferase involved in cell wall biosynthesis